MADATSLQELAITLIIMTWLSFFTIMLGETKPVRLLWFKIRNAAWIVLHPREWKHRNNTGGRL